MMRRGTFSRIASSGALTTNKALVAAPAASRVLYAERFMRYGTSPTLTF
jgi:septal ring factor EnvC (AmiA/AmiB activator)